MEPPAKRGRGRPRKSQETPAPKQTARVTRRSLPTRETSPSASSVPTPLDGTSESDYSTPGTSKNPTPSISEIGGSSKPRPTQTMRVELPSRGLSRERGLRNSEFAMKSKLKNEISDSDEDDFSDDSPDAKVARRLQLEEDQKGAATRKAPSFGKSSVKRQRASNVPIASAGRPAKKARYVQDSEEEDDVDMADDEAVARQLQEEEWKKEASSHVPPKMSDDSLSDEWSSSDSDEDEPLKSTRARAAKKRKPVKFQELPEKDPEDDDESSSLNTEDLATSSDASDSSLDQPLAATRPSITEQRRGYRQPMNSRRGKSERNRLEAHHPEIKTMWDDLKAMPILNAGKAEQPQTISRRLKPFQLEGLAWMKKMEQTEWKGGLLGDEMGLGKTIQAVSLIMSDYPAKQPTLVLVPPVALMQWQSEINSYTDGTLKTFVFHGTNQKAKGITIQQLKKYNVIMMSYNSLESMYRKQEKGFTRKNGIHKEKSAIHAINFHRIILDEAHSIKTRSTMTAKACFALKTDFRWCLTGTPLQNRIGEFFSLIRFLNIQPFSNYLCKQCPCKTMEWSMDEDKKCSKCNHAGMQHVSVFNQELLNPIQKFGNFGPGREAFAKLRLMTERIMLRRLKKDHTNSMELPVKEIYVDRQFFGEEENDFANSIMSSGQRKFDTYVAQGVLLNNYANIFGLIMQMRQVADHPDLILKKNAEGGQNVLVCCICDEPAEDTVRSRCKHDFCRTCVASYVRSTDTPDCPRCHIPLSIDLEQPEIEQEENMVKKSSIINRIKMENWTSSSKIELLVHELHKLRSNNATHKSIIFSQFTTMLQLIEWRLRRAGITTVMLDGSMTPAQRQASIEHFMNNVDVECFLVSLKAGGVALNLTEASRVFIVDP